MSVAEAILGFQERLGYVFRDLELLERALTHKSFANERREGGSPNNERLEFLGDAVLGFLVGDLLYRTFPHLQEGALSKIKAHLVSSAILGEKGRALEAANAFVTSQFTRDISGIDLADLSFHDYKTVLQEAAQGLGLPLPEYRVVGESGPDHEKAFEIEVVWDGEPFAAGRGSSKREAQRKAAKEALKKLGRLPA